MGAPSQILPNLWLGGVKDVTPSFLESRGIRRILSLLQLGEPKIASCSTVTGRREYNISDSETTDLSRHFHTIVPWIHLHRDDGDGIYVHCAKGISRSTTCVCAYLMVYLKISAQEALAHIKSRRPMVRPNKGFMQQLMFFEASEQRKVLAGIVSDQHKHYYQDDLHAVTRKLVVVIPDIVPKDVHKQMLRCLDSWDPDVSRIQARRHAVTQQKNKRILQMKTFKKKRKPFITFMYRGEYYKPQFTDTVAQLTFPQMRKLIHAYSTRKAGVPPIFERMTGTDEAALLWSLVALLYSLSGGESGCTSFSTPRAMPVPFDDEVIAELIAVSKPEVDEEEAKKRMGRLACGLAPPASASTKRPASAATPSKARKFLRLNIIGADRSHRPQL